MNWNVTLDAYSVVVEHDGVMDETEAIRLAKLSIPGKDFAVQNAVLVDGAPATLPVESKKSKRKKAQ